MTTTFNRRSALKLGGSLLAATALTPQLAFAQGDERSTTGTPSPASPSSPASTRCMKLFAAAHPDITVTPENIPNPEFMAKITAAVVAGSRPERHHGGVRAVPGPARHGRAASTSPTASPAGSAAADFDDAALRPDHRTTARSTACRPSPSSTGSTTARTGSTRPASPCRRRLPSCATPRSS